MTHVKNFHRISSRTQALARKVTQENMRSKAFNVSPSYPLKKRDSIDRDETCFSNVPSKRYTGLVVKKSVLPSLRATMNNGIVVLSVCFIGCFFQGGKTAIYSIGMKVSKRYISEPCKKR